MTDPAAIPLQARTRRDSSTRRTSVDAGQEEASTTAIDVSSIAGLVTILTVNIHQLESLLQVGPELGPRFWISIVLTGISIVCVYPLIIIRKVLGEKKPPSHRKEWLNWTSLVLTVLIFTINLTLQIISDIGAQCLVLNQQLPPVPRALS
uniref:Uncharacterized protein n=1 Tax=Anopheles atroparvus TaxID=41427 RepID=A0AAG5CPA5_ANOAO